jgi:polar amino acid transport system substrate-binding protein
MNTITCRLRLPRLAGLLTALLLPALALADGLTDILARKTVRIGVCEFAPWTFTSRAGQLEGFEIDVGRQIAHDLGVTPEFKVYTLETVFDAADRGEIDFIAGGLAITPARALRVEFSTPYFESGTTLVTNRRLAPGAKSPADLNRKGYVIAIVADTFSAGLAGQLFDAAEIKTFADGPAAEKELAEGRVHAYLTSVPDARIVALHHPDVVDLPLAAPLVKSVSGLAVKRGNQAVLNYLNSWVVAHWADNLLPSLAKYWFSGDEWIQNLKSAAK